MEKAREIVKGPQYLESGFGLGFMTRYVCMHACMHACMYVCINTHTHAGMSVHTQRHVNYICYLFIEAVQKRYLGFRASCYTSEKNRSILSMQTPRQDPSYGSFRK